MLVGLVPLFVIMFGAFINLVGVVLHTFIQFLSIVLDALVQFTIIMPNASLSAKASGTAVPTRKTAVIADRMNLLIIFPLSVKN